MDSGLQYNTICIHRSAISRYHRGIGGTKVGQHPMISQFLKGVFNAKPPSRILVPSWDLTVVLEALQRPPFTPLATSSLKFLTLKTVFLVAITSARRVSEIHSLGRNSPFARFERHLVCLNSLPGFLSKNSNLHHLGAEIVLPCFCTYNDLLCVRCILKHYIEVTNNLVEVDTNRLFVSFGGGTLGKAVTCRTISSWLVRVIRLAYEAQKMQPPEVRAHSTRGAATSWGLFQKASLDQIIQAADWKTSTTFVRHYRLHIWKQNRASFGSAVLHSAS